MSFKRRFVDILLFTSVTLLLVGGLIAFAINFVQAESNSGDFTVKALNPVKSVPKAKYIPVKVKSNRKADISNSILTPRAKKPVVISI